MTPDHPGPSISTADPIAAGYSAGASAVNGATLAARPGDAPNVVGEHPLPVSDDELLARLDGLLAAQDALVAALSTLRDSDAAARCGVKLDDATEYAARAARAIHVERQAAWPEDVRRRVRGG